AKARLAIALMPPPAPPPVVISQPVVVSPPPAETVVPPSEAVTPVTTPLARLALKRMPAPLRARVEHTPPPTTMLARGSNATFPEPPPSPEVELEAEQPTATSEPASIPLSERATADLRRLTRLD